MTCRRFMVIGCWMMLVGIVMLTIPDNRLTRGIIMTVASPLFLLAYHDSWKPKGDREKP